MPGHMDPNTGQWVEEDNQPDPNAGGLAGQQEQAADMAPPPPGDQGAAPEPEPEPEPTEPEPGASPPAPGGPAIEDPTQIPPGGTTTPDAAIETAITGGEPPDLTIPPPEDTKPPLGPDDAMPPEVPPAPKPIVPAATQDELTQQKIDERQGQSVEDQSALEAKAQNARDILKLRQDAQKQRADIIKQGEDDFAAARAKQNAEYEKYRAMGERDAWGDHSTAKKILAGIAIILGGRSAAALVIGAAQGFEERKKEQLALQKTAMEKAGHDASEIEAKQKEDLANLQQQTAAGLDATAARLDAELAARGVPANQRAANKDVLAIKQAGFDKKRQAEIDAHKWEEQKIKDGLAKQKTDSEIALNKAHASLYDRMPVKKPVKASGGGAGTGVGADGLTPAEKLSAALEKGMPDGNGGFRPLTPTEEIHAAADVGIPVKAKAGVLTLKDVKANAAFNADQHRKQLTSDRAGVKHDEATIYDPWSGQPIGPAPNTRSLGVARKSQGAGAQLVETLKSYRKFLADHGTKNWTPEEVAQGESAWADAVGQGRVWSELPSSEAGLDLEKAKYGGKPVAWDLRPTSTKVIDDQINHVIHVTKMRANILAGKPMNYEPPKGAAVPGASDPLAPAGGGAAPAAPQKAPASDPKLEAAQRVKDDPTAPPAARARAQKYWLEHRP